MRVFFKHPKYDLRHFRVFLVVLSAQCASLVCDFALLNHFFCKKLRFLYILHDFLFGIWAVQNLGSSHDASVFHGFEKPKNRNRRGPGIRLLGRPFVSRYIQFLCRWVASIIESFLVFSSTCTSMLLLHY